MIGFRSSSATAWFGNAALGLVLGGAIGGASGGCALLPLAALGAVGNVADIGSAAFSAGTEVFSGGKLESFEFCSLAQGQAAVRSTLNDLRLHQTQAEFKTKTAFYRFEDDQGRVVDIDVDRHSPAVCAVRVDVGFLGSEAYARLLLKSVRARLPLVQGAAATRPSAPVDLNAPRTYDRRFAEDNLGR